MIKKLILITLILSLFLTGCQPVEETTEDISVNSEITEIDSLDEDLNTDDLDSIEDDLDEINW